MNTLGNYAQVREEIKNTLISRVPLIVLRSSERERAEKMFRELAKEMSVRIYYYTDVKQVAVLNSAERKDADKDPMVFAQELFRKNRNSTFVIGDARRLSEENTFSREVLDTLYLAMETSSTLVLVTPDYIWNRLAMLGLTFVLDYPDINERESIIRSFISKYQGRFVVEWDDETVEHAAMLIRGFSEVQINNILRAMIVANNGLKLENVKDLTLQKSKLYAAVPCVDEVRIRPDMKLAGLDNLKKWVRERKSLFFYSDEVLERYELTAPKGILLAGIPGCGKSYASRMIASEWELPLFRFDIGSVYDKWMGESERKMQDALIFIENMAPCVVWIDEIEKALSVSDSGNDTGKRVLGQFLYWLQESASRVFLVATANDVMSMPPELFRKGRFSELFFIDLPVETERTETIVQYSAKCLKKQWNEQELKAITDAADGFSYSDIEGIIKEAAQYALLNGDKTVSVEKMVELFKNNISYSSTNPESVNRLREWGQTRAINASKY